MPRVSVARTVTLTDWFMPPPDVGNVSAANGPSVALQVEPVAVIVAVPDLPLTDQSTRAEATPEESVTYALIRVVWIFLSAGQGTPGCSRVQTVDGEAPTFASDGPVESAGAVVDGEVVDELEPPVVVVGVDFGTVVVGATTADEPGAVEDVTPAGVLVVVVAWSPVGWVVEGVATALVAQSTTGRPSIESSARTAVADTHDRAARSVGLRSSTQR